MQVELFEMLPICKGFKSFMIYRVLKYSPDISPEEIDKYAVKLIQEGDIEIVCHRDFSEGCR